MPLVVLMMVGVITPPASADEPWSGSITLVSSAASYTSNDATPYVGAAISPSLSSGYALSIYNDLGHLVCSQTTVYNGGCSTSAPAPLNGTRTYTAYVAAGTPPSSGPPTNDVRATSNSVTITNLGYVNQSITLSSNMASYTTNDNTPSISAAISPTLTGGYALSIYNDLGQRVCSQTTTYNGGCSTSAPAPLNGTRTYTAYVAYGTPPANSPPTNDVRATSNSVTITNLGYVNQSITLSATATSYTTNDATPYVSAAISPTLTGGYALSIYNDLGQLVCSQTTTYNAGCSSSAPAPMNGTRTYRAYVAYGPPPSNGPPTNDVRATSTPVTITNRGYVNQSITLSVTATSYTASDATPSLTAQISPYLTGGYTLSVYNDLGQLVCSQTSTYSSACSASAPAPMNGSRTYRAYVAYGTPPASGPPTNDVRATSNTVTITKGYDVSANLGVVPNSADAGDPVNVATGNFHDTVTDLAFAVGSGLPALARTYNSRDTSVGTLGQGWSNSFTSSIQTDALGNALVRTGDGKTLRFVLTSGGGFLSPAGFAGTLARQANGGWLLTARSGGTISYDLNGRLLSLANPDGTVATLSYTGAQLTGVTASTGASMTFTYDAGSGRLTSVASNDGRSVSFAYTSGRLASATNVDGASTTYRYDAGGFLDKIVGPDGRTKVVNSYDGLGRVTLQQTPQGQTLSYAYSDNAARTTTVAESSGASTTYTFDAAARLLSITDSTGHSMSRSYDGNGFVAGTVTRLTVNVNVVTDAAGNVTSRVVPGGTEQYSYDSSNRLIRAEDVLNRATGYSYTGTNRIPSTITWPDSTQTTQTITNGLVTSRTDADGVTTSFGYDSARNLISTQVGSQPATSMTYDTAGRMLTRTSPGGHTTTWTYDPAGRMLTDTDPAGAVTTYGYDGAGHLTSSTDPDQHTTSYVYDAAGQLTETHYPDGTISSNTYDNRGQLLTETKPGNAVTQYSYGPLGRLTSVTDPMGRVTSYGYNADGQVTTTTTAGGISTSEYNPAGQLISSTNPANQTTTYTRDALERVTAVTDPTGAITRSRYDSMGRVDKSTDALNRETSYAYTPGGRLSTITYPGGGQRVYGYDTAGRRNSDTAPGGGSTQTTYTPDGQPATVTSPAGLVTSYGYDPVGRTTSVTTPGRGTTSTSYTPAGQVATRTDAAGGLVQFGYDVRDRLATAADPLGKTTSYGYDTRGNRTTVTDPLTHVWTTTFNLNDEPTGTTDPLGNASSVSYDQLGRVLTSADASGVTSANSYDLAGNLTRVTFADTSHTDYTYDAAARRLTAATAAGTETFSYDPAGQLLSDTIGSRTVGYSYNLQGRVATITYPDGSTTTRGYDPKGNLLTASHTGGGQASYTYNADGHVLTATAGSGSGQRSRSYTWTGGLLAGYSETASTGTTSSTLNYDTAGRLTRLATGTGETTYGYDPAGQLLAVTAPAGQSSQSYSYDPLGNLSTATIGGATTSYSYDAADQLTNSTSTAGATSYNYDQAGRLLTSTGPTSSSSNSYDPQGRLLLSSTSAAGTSTSRTRGYTPAGELASVTTMTSTQLLPAVPATVSSSTTALTWDRTHSIPQPLVLTSAGADSNLTLGPGNDLAYASTTSTPAAAFSHNALGDLLPTTNTTGLVQGSSNYTAYGQPSGTSSSIGFGYRGQLHTGNQLYLHHRTLDPSLGRFTSRDPLDGTPGQTVASNPYHYAGNDPINQADPSGLSPSITDVEIQAGFAPATLPIALAATCARPVNKWQAEVCLSAELALQGAAAVAVGAAIGCTADVLIFGSFCGVGSGTSNGTQTPTVTEPQPTPTPTGGVPTKPRTAADCQEGLMGSWSEMAPHAAQGICERHHIIQDAAVYGFVTVANGFLGNYSYRRAPVIMLTQANHHLANVAQIHAPECGTYRAEKDAAIAALEAAGQTANVDNALRRADAYFNPLGVSDGRTLARPANRLSCRGVA